MTIQESIIQALHASHEAHQSGLAALTASQAGHQQALSDITQLQGEKATLEAKVAALEAQVADLQAKVADLEGQVSHHEAESVKIVDPDQVTPLLHWLSRAVAATHSAITPAVPVVPAPAETPRAEAPHAEAPHAEAPHAEAPHAETIHAEPAAVTAIEPAVVETDIAPAAETHEKDMPLEKAAPMTTAPVEAPSIEMPVEHHAPIVAPEAVTLEHPVTAHSAPRTIILDTLSADPEPAEKAEESEEPATKVFASHGFEALRHGLHEAEAKLEPVHTHASTADDKGA